MQRQRTLVALLVVLTVGSAVATGGAVGQTASIDTHPPAVSAADSPECEYPLTVEDATGAEITIDDAPENVVVTNANVAQHIWEMGAAQKVTGMPVAPYTAYLDGSDERTNVIESGGVNVLTEEVIDLDPDLVLAPNSTLGEDVETLRELGRQSDEANFEVYHYESVTDLDHMVEITERTGRLISECDAATEVTSELRADIEMVDEAMADVEPVDIYYDMGFPFTVGEGTLEHDVFRRAGGNNVVPDAGYTQVQDEEQILDWDPEWLIVREGADVPDGEGFQATTAVQEDQIIEVDPNALSQHGPRNVEVLVQIAERLHPDAMEDAREALADEQDARTDTPGNDTETTGAENTTDATTTGETDTTTTEETDTEAETAANTDDDGPGLTAGAAVAALVALALIATRRR